MNPTKHILLLTTFTFLLWPAQPIMAKIGQMDSDGYVIQMPNINMTSGNKDSDNYAISDTVGQTFQGLFDSDGYTVKAGFQYIYTLYSFSFSISSTEIDFGSLTIGTPVVRSNQLTISAPGAGGYQITSFEFNPLKLVSGSAEIPDTECDSGDPCDEITAKAWTSNSRYGFGFNMNSDTHPGDIPADFIDTTYYRQFADVSKTPVPEEPQIVMSSSIASRSAQSTVRYKVNIDANQAAGNYSTGIVFVASPAY